MAQKIIKIGKSTGITIPKEVLQELGWKIGDKVYLHPDFLRKRIAISKSINEPEVRLSKKDLELLRWVDKFMEKYRADLEALARQ